MINFALLKHPLNWLIVLLMLTIAGIAGHLVLTHFGAEPNGPSPDGTVPPGETTRDQIVAMTLG